MSSITYWNRLEPRPRSESVREPLAARIRDPLWMLTRQWQFGEFQGEDAGSPAFVQVRLRNAPLMGWRVDGAAIVPLAMHAPLEQQTLRELAPPDLGLAVE